MSPINATLPFQLDTPEFKKAWEDYVEYRRQSKLKKLLPMSVERQWTKMADVGPEVAIEAIDQTIANGWMGLFLPPELRDTSPPQQFNIKAPW